MDGPDKSVIFGDVIDDTLADTFDEIASSIFVGVLICPILSAIVWKVASYAVLTPLSVIALAISDFPLLTDVFKDSISEDALHCIALG